MLLLKEVLTKKKQQKTTIKFQFQFISDSPLRRSILFSRRSHTQITQRHTLQNTLLTTFHTRPNTHPTTSHDITGSQNTFTVHICYAHMQILNSNANVHRNKTLGATGCNCDFKKIMTEMNKAFKFNRSCHRVEVSSTVFSW